MTNPTMRTLVGVVLEHESEFPPAEREALASTLARMCRWRRLDELAARLERAAEAAREPSSV